MAPKVTALSCAWADPMSSQAIENRENRENRENSENSENRLARIVKGVFIADVMRCR